MLSWFENYDTLAPYQLQLSKTMETPQTQLQIALNAQYAKDISFESPTSPLELANLKTPIAVEISTLDIKVQDLGNDTFEVALKIAAKAKAEEKPVYVVELEYAGAFVIKNLEKEEHREQILLIYCPNMLFPFARRIIADLTRDGGYQPLMLNPLDFASLYLNQKKNQAANEGKGNGAAIEDASEPAPSKKKK